MTDGQSTLLANIERFERARDDLDAKIREAHEAAAEIKEQRRLLKEDHAKFVEGADKVWQAALEQKVKELGEAVRKQTNAAHARVMDSVTELCNMQIYGNKQGKGLSVFEELRLMAEGMERNLKAAELRIKKVTK